ncbi:unnamed protein product, partial [Prorocentrum cordatum]
VGVNCRAQLHHVHLIVLLPSAELELVLLRHRLGRRRATCHRRVSTMWQVPGGRPDLGTDCRAHGGTDGLADGGADLADGGRPDLGTDCRAHGGTDGLADGGADLADGGADASSYGLDYDGQGSDGSADASPCGFDYGSLGGGPGANAAPLWGGSRPHDRGGRGLCSAGRRRGPPCRLRAHLQGDGGGEGGRSSIGGGGAAVSGIRGGLGHHPRPKQLPGDRGGGGEQPPGRRRHRRLHRVLRQRGCRHRGGRRRERHLGRGRAG